MSPQLIARARSLQSSLSSLRGGGIAVGSIIGSLIAFSLLPGAREWFGVPDGGVGFVTVHSYPKQFDYFALVAVIAASFVGGLVGGTLFRRRSEVTTGPAAESTLPRLPVLAGLFGVVAVLMFLIHFHPHQLMDMFHEGEHLTPGFVLESGGRAYGDIFFLHGLVADGLIESTVWGSEMTVWRSRLVRAILDSLTLALIVPLAFVVTRVKIGAIVAILLSLCGAAAGALSVFPYFRLLPGVVSLLLLTLYVRRGSPWWLVGSIGTASLGLLWSLDVGMYSLATTGIAWLVAVVSRPRERKILVPGVMAVLLPLLVLLVLRADISKFLHDSFVIIPSAMDAIWSLPAPELPSLEWLRSRSASDKPWEAPSIQYYAPLVLYGAAALIAFRDLARGRRERALMLLSLLVFSIFLFRSAAGRTGWGHTRFASLFVGMIFVSVCLEPLALQSLDRIRRIPWRIASALTLMLCLYGSFRYFELPLNYEYTVRYFAEWDERFNPPTLVPYPSGHGGRTLTYEQNATELAQIRDFSDSWSKPDEVILDLSGELALYYFLERTPAVRTPNVAMLSNPFLQKEALRSLNERPPAFVIFGGGLNGHDGLSHRQRVPELFAWAEQRYPQRLTVGRFDVGLTAAAAPVRIRYWNRTELADLLLRLGYDQSLIVAVTEGERAVGALVTERLAETAHLEDREFVRILYEVLLERPPDAEGWATHVKSLTNGVSRAAMAEDFVESAEFRRKYSQLNP